MIRRTLHFLADLFGLRVQRQPSEAAVESAASQEPVHDNDVGTDRNAAVQPLSPEEQLIRDSMPPSAVAETVVISPVSRNGQIP